MRDPPGDVRGGGERNCPVRPQEHIKINHSIRFLALFTEMQGLLGLGGDHERLWGTVGSWDPEWAGTPGASGETAWVSALGDDPQA